MNAVITGANRGIGRAMVEAFAEKGYGIWACARKKNDEFEADMSGLAEKFSVEVEPVYFDMSDEAQIKDGAKHILSAKRSIDVLINNAGVAHGGSFVSVSQDKLREIFQMNVFSQVLLTQLLVRAMIRQKSGCVINMCSAGGLDPQPGCLSYGASKATMIYITKVEAREFAPFNIRVNALAPGLIDTEMGHYKNDVEIQKTLNRMCIKHMGSVKDVADAALYIAGAEFMTGHILTLDGGHVIGG
ncbi:MAG: SDR family oxidoreductase [Synergistaceae bacterium]|nr:SDR family oxidoreductase [Synergistaceae bacterium]